MTLWLVTFAYFSERADVYVVAAPDERAARQRVAAVASEGWRDRVSAEGLRNVVLESALVEPVRDGLHIEQDAEY